MDIIKNLELHKEYTYPGTLKELENNLFNYKGGTVKKIGDGLYKIYPDVSWGTLISNNGPGIVDGINVLMSITNAGNDKQIVSFRAKVRVEHLFIIIALSFMLICFTNASEKIPPYVFCLIIGTWVISHVWFQSVYRGQENDLVDNVVENLGLA